MSSAIVPSHRSRRQRHSDQRVSAARRDAFHRSLRYEALEDRRLLSIGDKIVNISAPDHTAGEPLDTGTFRITRSGSTTNALTVNFCTTGDATPSLTGIGGDYYLEKGTTLLSGTTVTIDAGQVYVDVTLVPYDDGQIKPDKTAMMMLETGTGYDVGTAYEASITLHNEITGTLPSISVVAPQPTASNGPSPVDGVFRISRPSDADKTSALTVNFQMSGTAVQGTDYTLSYTDGTGATQPITSPDSVKIAAGQDHVDVDLKVTASTVALQDETATLTLTSGSDYAIDTDQSSASITVTHVSGTAVTVAATDATAGFPSDAGTFVITCAGSTRDPLTIYFHMAGTAVQGTDYLLSDPTTNPITADSHGEDSVRIAAGQSDPITLTVVKDATTAETATLVLDSPSGCGYGVGAAPGDSATINVLDEDPDVVTVSAPDSTAAAPLDTGTYHIARTGSLVSALTVNFSTGGDAKLGTGNDYTLSAGGTPLAGNTVTIAAGQTYVDVTLTPLTSSTTTSTKTASLTVQTGSGYQIGVSSSAAISIVENNATSVSISAINDFAAELSDGTVNGTFRITRTGGDQTSPLTVDFAVGGTAIRTTDSTANSSTWDYELMTKWVVDASGNGSGTLVTGNSVTIGAGQSSIDVTLVVADHVTPDYPRTVIMTLTDGMSLGASATITIGDDRVQWQTILPESLCSAAGEPISIPVHYTTSNNDAAVSGLGLKLYYNSSFMTFTGLTGVLQAGLVSQEAAPMADTLNGDSDASTDEYIMVSWADLAGNWPNQALSATLFTANFTLASNVTASETSKINFSANAAAGYTFQPRSTTVTVAPIKLDVDGNGASDPLTDGILIMRYLFAQGGTWSTDGAIGTSATRTTYDQINSYLDAASSTMLDVDGNGQADALTDGMLIMRYLFDPSGDWTVNGLVGPNATRTAQAAIKSFLDSYFVAGAGPHALMNALASPQESSAMVMDASAGSQSTGSQIVTPSQTNISAAAGSDVAFDVNYSTDPSDPTLSGLGLRMYYDSSKLTFNALSNVLANGNISQEMPQDDTDNSDGDASTDKYVLVGWADLSQNWPGAATQRLYTADFTLNSAATSATHVNFGASSTAAGWTFASTPVTVTPNNNPPAPAGPTIGSVVFSAGKKVISWNAADNDGVAASHLQIDGKSVSQVYGPYQAVSGVNYSASTAALAVGHYTYVITATDKAGHTSSYSGSFDVIAATDVGPTIGSVVFSAAKKVISWNAADNDGVASSYLQIDGKNVSQIYGPYQAASGVNYAGSTAAVVASDHSYLITAIDKTGHSSSYNGTFTVVAVAPTISAVVVALAKNAITWNVVSPNGVASVALSIDNRTVSGIGGPYAAASGANYHCSLGALPVGNHSYAVTVTDRFGQRSTVQGTFHVASSPTVANNAVFAALAANAAASAKLDWLYDGSDLATV